MDNRVSAAAQMLAASRWAVYCADGRLCFCLAHLAFSASPVGALGTPDGGCSLLTSFPGNEASSLGLAWRVCVGVRGWEGLTSYQQGQGMQTPNE